MKLTVRLGKPGKRPVDLLKPNHNLDGPINDWNDIKGSQLFHGQSYDGEPAWVEFLEDGTEEQLELNNQGAAALLFIPSGDQFLIYIFGYGFLSIQTGYTVWDFGLKVVLNSVNSNGLKSVDSYSLNQKAKNRRVQLGTQGSVGEFDVDLIQDLVSKISGISTDTTFAKSLTGGESLSITFDMEGTSVGKKSREIVKTYKKSTYKKSFGWIDFISPIKDQDLIDDLNAELVAEINRQLPGASNGSIVLSFPAIIDMDNLDHFRFQGYGSSKEYSQIGFETFKQDYRENGYVSLNHDLNKVSIKLYDGHSKPFQTFTLYKAITSEVEFIGAFYIVSHGQWFQLNKTHYETVSIFFDDFLLSNEYIKIGQTTEESESGYLTTISGPTNELLDRKLFYATSGARNTIEYADIVDVNRNFIHVKDGRSSSNLSHLFNQGFASAQIMNNDRTYRIKLTGTIKNKAIKKAFKSTKFDAGEFTIVYRILRKGPDFTLPFFSKIILYDTYNKIKAMGYKFKLEWVEYV